MMLFYKLIIEISLQYMHDIHEIQYHSKSEVSILFILKYL